MYKKFNYIYNTFVYCTGYPSKNTKGFISWKKHIWTAAEIQHKRGLHSFWSFFLPHCNISL